MANNFVSNANATDLMNAINQKKDTKPDTITWAEWIQLTDQEREGTHYIITDVPAQFSLNDAIFSLKNQTLVFTNKVATITDSRITSSAYLFTFYANEAVAQAAGIECTWSTGTITFTVVNDPVSDITLDILAILPALAPGGGEQIQSDWNQTDTSEPDYIKNKPTIPDISTKVSKSGDTMSGSLQINKPSASTSTEVSNLYLGNNIAGGTTGNSYGALTLFGKGTYKGRFIDIENALTADRDYQLPNKSGTLALTSDFDDITRPSRASVSVLTYATTLSEGIHFYTTTPGTTDNPTTVGSYAFIIYRASTGITIFGMPLASRDAFLNASANNGTTWSGWLNIMDFVSKTSGGTFGGGINIDQKNGTASSVGNSSISLGNSTPQGTDKNSRGLLVIWGKGNCFGQIFDNNTNGLTANRNYYLPDKSGTLALTSDIPTISFNGTLSSGQNVLTVAKNMPNNSISYYKNSNKPTNRPTNGDYGAYEFIKSDNMTMIKYIAENMTACAYGIDSSTTSITWHIS